MYATRHDLEMMFGKTNITKWADVNNENANVDINERIAWALDMAANTLNDRLRYGPYAVPFTLPIPQTIVFIHTLLTGVQLYEARGVVDAEDGMHQLQWHRKKADEMIRDILTRRLRLNLVTQATEVPLAISSDS